MKEHTASRAFGRELHSDGDSSGGMETSRSDVDDVVALQQAGFLHLTGTL